MWFSKKYKLICPLIFFFHLFNFELFAQRQVILIDGRENKECSTCKGLIDKKPKEVLFGVQINDNGDVYFSMDNIEWFKKIFQNDSYGLTTDLISEDAYSCTKAVNTNSLVPKGTILAPIFTKTILSKNESSDNGIYVKIGKIPKLLSGKKVEGNLVILNGNQICYYTNFVNISRHKWDLLPMGLFADSLIMTSSSSQEPSSVFTYSRKTQVSIPFSKGSSSYDKSYLKIVNDSVDLKKYKIEKVEIRAYSSVEGNESINLELMKKRGEAMIQALSTYQSSAKRSSVLTAENWLDFFSDIKDTEFNYLGSLSKSEIKGRLTEPGLASKIEPLLAKERKSIATLYLQPKSVDDFDDSRTINDFRAALTSNQLSKARSIQKSVIERIRDNKLPIEYLNKLEVPLNKNFSLLLNDREVYKFLFKLTSEHEALENLSQIKSFDPANGYVNYNISALKLFAWQYGYDLALHHTLQKEIGLLPRQGIHPSLVKRMFTNYSILKCEDFMNAFDYESKDSTLTEIQDSYEDIETSNEEAYSLARYYSYYSHKDWAMKAIAPKVMGIDASEDLVFYYLNLLFYHSEVYDTDIFRKISLNAINLNKVRFCNFFLPNDAGGASMQLLDDRSIRNIWCQECVK